MSAKPEALRLADRLDLYAAGDDHQRDTEQASAELRRLHEENQRLKTVMIAAAEELAKHWEAHCDAEGYGPVNLLRRLEKGIAAEYGYTAGSFARLNEVNQELLEALKVAACEIADWGSYASEYFQNKHDLKGAISRANAAIAKATGERDENQEIKRHT